MSFDWDWSYEAPDGVALVVDDFNLNFSPLVIGTDDGFTESANVIPGSWVQHETNGFIFGCDGI